MTQALPPDAHLAALGQIRWTELLPAIDAAVEWLSRQPFADNAADEVATALAQLASHEKWEVRRAVALAAGKLRHHALGDTLPRLLADANTSVQKAAESSNLKRREFRISGELGRERASRVNRALGDIAERHGTRARSAVQRVAAEMVNTFSRELYHEVVHHLTPLSREIAQLRSGIANDAASDTLVAHVDVIQRDVSQIISVLKSMRRYTAAPPPSFSEESLRGVVDDSIHTVSELITRFGVRVENRVPKTVGVEIARERFVQALANLLHNSVESYVDLDRRDPIVIDGSEVNDTVRLAIRDYGCGMSAERARDARVLFATHKPSGSGIGLPLAIKIVDSEHDGELTIASAEGEGTTVTIVVPRFQRIA